MPAEHLYQLPESLIVVQELVETRRHRFSSHNPEQLVNQGGDLVISADGLFVLVE